MRVRIRRFGGLSHSVTIRRGRPSESKNAEGNAILTALAWAIRSQGPWALAASLAAAWKPSKLVGLKIASRSGHECGFGAALFGWEVARLQGAAGGEPLNARWDEA